MRVIVQEIEMGSVRGRPKILEIQMDRAEVEKYVRSTNLFCETVGPDVEDDLRILETGGGSNYEINAYLCDGEIRWRFTEAE